MEVSQLLAEVMCITLLPTMAEGTRPIPREGQGTPPGHDPTLRQPVLTPQQPGHGSRDKMSLPSTQHEVSMSLAWLQKTNPSGSAPW